MGKNSAPPPPPNYQPIADAQNNAATLAAQTAADQLAWAKEQYGKDREFADKQLGIQAAQWQQAFDAGKKANDDYMATLKSNTDREFAAGEATRKRVLDTILPMMESEAAEGKRLRERYQTVFEPLEDKFVKEAANYNSPERLAQARGKAIADVSDSFAQQRAAAAASLESYGVDPSQVRSAALDKGLRIAQAGTSVAAANDASMKTDMMGRAMQTDAINLGRGTQAASNQAMSVAQGASSQAGATGNQAISTGFQGAATGLNYGSTQQQIGAGLLSMANGTNYAPETIRNSNIGVSQASTGQQATFLNNWGSLLSNMYSTQMDGYKAQAARPSALGSALGAVGSLAGASIGAGGWGGLFKMAEGGEIPPELGDGTGRDDMATIRVSGGEFVVPASVVRRLGTDYFDKLAVKKGDHRDARAAERRMGVENKPKQAIAA